MCRITSDIDECELGLADCDGNAYCTNTTGSYTCTCNKGYTGEGHNGFCEGTIILHVYRFHICNTG